MTTRSEATLAARPLDRMVVRLRCWWYGHEQHPQDPTPPDEATCMHCGGYVPYGDMVGDTRHNRTMDWRATGCGGDGCQRSARRAVPGMDIDKTATGYRSDHEVRTLRETSNARMDHLQALLGDIWTR